jgi:hypothetical protein
MAKVPLIRRRQARRMINANRYLKRRCGKDRSGERWYLQLPVPKDLRERFGWTIERALNTSDPRVARIRRDAMLPDLRALFDRARAEPTLGEVIPAVRRAELARAHAEWSELIADRGVANVARCWGCCSRKNISPMTRSVSRRRQRPGSSEPAG